MTLLPPNTLVSAIWPGANNSLSRQAVLVVAGTALFTVSAKIQVPFYPVPMTLQTFAILVLAMAYGWRLGGLTVLAYLLAGMAGLPVFAGTPERGIGLAYMIGPSGGYLVGFLASALVVGRLADFGWDKTRVRTLIAMSIGTAVIVACGAGWLATWVGFGKAMAIGVVPFLAGAAFKIGLAAVVLPAAWGAVNRHR
jgi:biotin transport system substrate-specific component